MTDETVKSDTYTLINELARRRGFFWQSYEIYGGVSGFMTYGPLGARLKQNIENKIRALFVNRLGIMEIESPIIAPEKVFEASGHVDHFKEPMVECPDCKRRYRADHLLQENTQISSSEVERLTLKEVDKAIMQSGILCPDCGGTLGKASSFLTMFKTTIGPYSNARGYGRPEAAQGIFVEFRRLYEMAREKVPFGVMQIGHALRNEISPRQGLIRQREFTIIDLEYFFDPESPDCFLLEDYKDETLPLLLVEKRQTGSEEVRHITLEESLKRKYIKADWQAVFMVQAKRLLVELGVPAEKQRFIEKFPWEKAHYAVQSFDQEVYDERWGWVEVSGHAYRTDYDLKRHMQFSGMDLRVYKEHEHPVVKMQTVVKPLMKKLGPAFKADAAHLAEELAKADAEEIKASFKKNGYYLIGEDKVLQEHVEIQERRAHERGKRFIPHVVEPSFGSDRLVQVTLEYAYQVREDRVVLKIPRDVAPLQLGLYPLVTKDGLPEKTSQIRQTLLQEGFTVEHDEAGSIGRRYARADEAGIPLGITVDYETLKDDTVTIRDRDSWRQVRSKVEELPKLLRLFFGRRAEFDDLGKPVDS